MNLLKEGTKKGVVLKTELSKKLTIDGQTKAYPVYKVHLDYLYYNDQNDRIATWISEYKSEHEGATPDISNIDKYNNLIEEYIVKSNPAAIRRTQANIELVDQREPGVVLLDGRIIDGNRRFACLRRLSKESEKFNYFETVILTQSIENNHKQIKKLELSLQHGIDEKVDYNTVDRLVGLYSDVVETKLLTASEYAISITRPIKEVRERIEIAKLMVEYLEFINAPKQFHIARNMEITFPLEEAYKLFKKCKYNEEIEDLKMCIFTNILLGTSSNMGRFIRNLKTIITSDYKDDFLEEQLEIAEEVIEELPQVGQVNETTISNLRSDYDFNEKLEDSVERADEKAKKSQTLKRPIQLVDKALASLEDIDIFLLLKMNEEDLSEMNNLLDKICSIAKELKGEINV